MKKALRSILLGLTFLVTLCAGLFVYFVYTPDPEEPLLTGTLTKATLAVNGETYTYRLYLPKDLAKDAPLVMVLHGSGQNGAQIRSETGYGFERLADQHGFAVVYPSGKSFDWNDCSKTGDFLVNGRELDDVNYLNTLVDTLIAAHGFDQRRVFATGVSAGGFMSLRLALESPERFRAVAAVSANVPAPDNFKCKPVAPGASVLLMNGTADTIVPYSGGEVELWGMFFQNGQVLSSVASAEFFAAQNKLPLAAKREAPLPDVKNVQRMQWQNEDNFEVELITILDGGHGMPQPHWQRPRLLGPSPMQPNGPELIWQFFARQKP
ncbi:alpha/beta hydrolase family esterase [Rheinheimera tilapiae]|uniref:Alpha/beta hydrolase family esterase n=1 Tax=Rheinheimera tilapiae TaxID=875043 RepID=A0ABV6BF21_9GAMM